MRWKLPPRRPRRAILLRCPPFSPTFPPKASDRVRSIASRATVSRALADSAARILRRPNAGGREDSTSEVSLVESGAYLPYGISALDGILDVDRFLLVGRPDEGSGGDQDTARDPVVADHEGREYGPVPAGARPVEVHKRNAKVVSGPQRTVVRLVDVAGAVVVEEAVGGLFVVVR